MGATTATHAFLPAVETLWTLFLFTKSDFKTVLIPVTVFALSVAPDASWNHMLQAVCWVWLHLLQADISNQTCRPDEDAVNKPYRPLPSGRITVKNALRLRWLLVPACWVVSAAYGVQVLHVSVLLAGLILVYNEGHAADRWLARNVMNAAGIACFESGATLITGADRARWDAVSIWAICMSAGVLATTIHAQDFRDEDGDRAVGRRTIPLVFPRIARYTMLVMLPAWSLALATMWKLGDLTAPFVLVAVFIGGRFVIVRTDDEMSYTWYNVWLSVVHILPGYYRYSQARS